MAQVKVYGIEAQSMNECWEWTKRLNDHGYGLTYVKGKQVFVHRVAWKKVFGKIPKGLCICHSCDNRKCFNPDHLWLGTHLENMQDMASKGVLLIHAARGEKQANAKFTDQQIKLIREEYSNNNISIRSLAKKNFVCYSTMHCILTRKTWKHIS